MPNITPPVAAKSAAPAAAKPAAKPTYAKPAAVQALGDPLKPIPITIPLVNGIQQTQLPYPPLTQPYLSNAIR